MDTQSSWLWWFLTHQATVTNEMLRVGSCAAFECETESLASNYAQIFHRACEFNLETFPIRDDRELFRFAAVPKRQRINFSNDSPSSYNCFIYTREKYKQASAVSLKKFSHFFVAPKVKIKKVFFHLPAHFSIFLLFLKSFRFCFDFDWGDWPRRRRFRAIFLVSITQEENLVLVTNKFAENLNHSSNFPRCKWENLWKLAQLKSPTCCLLGWEARENREERQLTFLSFPGFIIRER